ncbi:hypothetical protein Tco_0975737 [Tanacetum coccineum]|uniref:Reverse transcriptase domain-containing protein n=1 Tax=Tanacetum coccineum TaxID=301880 RepID=A0ABQ5EFC2_9ASTR
MVTPKSPTGEFEQFFRSCRDTLKDLSQGFEDFQTNDQAHQKKSILFGVINRNRYSTVKKMLFMHQSGPYLSIEECSAHTMIFKESMGSVTNAEENINRFDDLNTICNGTKCMGDQPADHNSLHEITLIRKRWTWSNTFGRTKQPLRVRALVMTIGLNLPKQILDAHELKGQRETKEQTIKNEDVWSMLVENSKEPEG